MSRDIIVDGGKLAAKRKAFAFDNTSNMKKIDCQRFRIKDLFIRYYLLTVAVARESRMNPRAVSSTVFSIDMHIYAFRIHWHILEDYWHIMDHRQLNIAHRDCIDRGLWNNLKNGSSLLVNSVVQRFQREEGARKSTYRIHQCKQQLDSVAFGRRVDLIRRRFRRFDYPYHRYVLRRIFEERIHCNCPDNSIEANRCRRFDISTRGNTLSMSMPSLLNTCNL